MMRSRTGAGLGTMPKPQLPITVVVTPSEGEGDSVGSQVIWASKWGCRSTMPGIRLDPAPLLAVPSDGEGFERHLAVLTTIRNGLVEGGINDNSLKIVLENAARATAESAAASSGTCSR